MLKRIGKGKEAYMTKKITRIIFFAAVILFFQTLPLPASPISVELLADKQEASVGEPISMQIRVQGTNSAAEPDLSGIDFFRIQPRGGQSTSSTQVTSMNGKWEKITNLGYVFNYTLIPEKSGTHTIPALALQIEGKTYSTQPLTIKVHTPVETEDFKLRIFLSSSKNYEGEPLLMTTTWFVGKDVNSFEFQMPVLDDPRFEIIPQKAKVQDPSQEVITIPLGNGSVEAVKGKGQLEGREFLTVTFYHLLAVKEHGSLTMPQTTVVCQTLSGFRQSRRRSPFSGFDDFFGNGREALYQTLVVPANTPRLEVLPLPEDKKPPSFSGLVGDYSIAAEATPLEVNIGDPITLTVKVTGPFSHKADMPDLKNFLHESSFKIPEEISQGETQGNSKIFTQTIRVTDDTVTEIPPLELVFFNPGENSYATAKTKALPLTVHPSRVVTALDAEGADPVRPGTELTVNSQGLAVDYEGSDVVIDHKDKSSSTTTMLLLFPPCMFALAGIFRLIQNRRRQSLPLQKSQKARATLEKTLNRRSLSAQDLDQCFRTYLAAKVQKNPRSLTFADIQVPLEIMKTPSSITLELKEIFEFFAKWHYSGLENSGEDLAPMKNKILAVARKLESSFP